VIETPVDASHAFESNPEGVPGMVLLTDHQTPQISFDFRHSRADGDGERTHRIPGGEHDGWLLQGGA
jgi:hypothetical protein